MKNIFTVSIKGSSAFSSVKAKDGEALSAVLERAGYKLPSFCGGNGTCKKCAVLVDGELRLACQTTVKSDISVELKSELKKINAVTGIEPTQKKPEIPYFALDIGTTTIALALCDKTDKSVCSVLSCNNPQSAFGADVMSRIAALGKHSVRELQKSLTDCLNNLAEQLLTEFGLKSADETFVAGNTVMLHLFFGVDCKAIGVMPYKASFLESKTAEGSSLGLKGFGKITSFPCVASFFGGDLTAGIATLVPPSDGKSIIICDLGTNAEIALINKEKILATSAAAGPCFEGASISHGMPAQNGAMSEFRFDGEKPICTVIGGTEAKGICGTGLFDAVAQLLDKYIIDETGLMEETDAFELCVGVELTQADIRAFQTAKSAVRSALDILIKRANISTDSIEYLYLSGGFASYINIESAARVGLFPVELKSKALSVGNTSLSGAVMGSDGVKKANTAAKKSEYLDLSADADFFGEFTENMLF